MARSTHHVAKARARAKALQELQQRARRLRELLHHKVVKKAKGKRASTMEAVVTVVGAQVASGLSLAAHPLALPRTRRRRCHGHYSLSSTPRLVRQRLQQWWRRWQPATGPKGCIRSVRRPPPTHTHTLNTHPPRSCISVSFVHMTCLHCPDFVLLWQILESRLCFELLGAALIALDDLLSQHRHAPTC